MNGEQREEFDTMLDAPLTGIHAASREPTQRELEAEGESFMAMMGALGAG